MSHLSYHLAQALIDEQLRVASERRRAKASNEPPAPAGDGLSAHERQRALVRASLLLSRGTLRPVVARERRVTS
jgi:hypothetical protein